MGFVSLSSNESHNPMFQSVELKPSSGPSELSETEYCLAAMQSKCSQYLSWLLKIAIVITCLILFFISMKDTYEKFEAKKATLCIRFESQDRNTIMPPCVTACSYSGFKTPGFHFNTDDYLNSTYNKSDIISMEYFNSSHYELSEVRSIFNGRCYTICATKPREKNEWFIVWFRKTDDMSMFIHEKSDRMWMSLYYQPVTINLFQLEVKGKPEIFSFEGKIQEKQTFFLNTESRPCKSYPEGSNFNSCSKMFFTKYFMESFNCSLPGMAELSINLTLEECGDVKSAWSSYNNLADATMINKETWLSQCPLPCKQKSYNLALAKFHRNAVAMIDPSEDNRPELFVFQMFYEEFVVEKVSESLRYDITEFLAQAGGNLGLYLGLSCLTVCYAVIEYLGNLNLERLMGWFRYRFLLSR